MQRGYFDDFRDFRDSKGKVFAAPQRLAPASHVRAPGRTGVGHIGHGHQGSSVYQACTPGRRRATLSGGVCRAGSVLPPEAPPGPAPLSAHPPGRPPPSLAFKCCCQTAARPPFPLRQQHAAAAARAAAPSRCRPRLPAWYALLSGRGRSRCWRRGPAASARGFRGAAGWRCMSWQWWRGW